ncbi:MAG TPA: DUF4157 domain-containing protein, partial [Gemmatimonadaceae bacterium]|nr:DUF4157 domain-containing protein [Gemmatimonadaceae bacterium]
MLAASKSHTKTIEGKAAHAEPRLDRKDVSKANPLWQALALSPTAFQPKLASNQADDPSEREADQIADRVMRITNPAGGGFPLSVGSHTSFKAQRKCAPCREEEEEKLERKAEGLNTNSSTTAPPIVSEALDSSGHTLDPVTRLFMEERFGHDFGQVRLHTDAKAAESARAVDALAYTVGNRIAFGAHQYRPETTEGRQLLAHELAHVTQQSATTTPRTIQRQARHGTRSSSRVTMVGRRFGRVSIRLANRAEPLSSELTVQSEVLPPGAVEADFTGYADEAEALRAAQGRGTVMAIVRLGTGRFRVLDTGRMPEQVAASLPATGVQVTVYSSHDYEFARWVNLNTQPQNLPEPPDNPQPMRGREVYGYAADELTSALRAFRVNNRLTSAQASTVVDAIFAITTSNASLRLALLTYYAAHPLSVNNISELMRTRGGSTTINPRIFEASEGFSPERIGGLLVHEFRHTGATADIMDITGDPVEEGRAYGIEYFFAEQRHDMMRQRGIGQVVLTGSSEI